MALAGVGPWRQRVVKAKKFCIFMEEFVFAMQVNFELVDDCDVIIETLWTCGPTNQKIIIFLLIKSRKLGRSTYFSAYCLLALHMQLHYLHAIKSQINNQLLVRTFVYFVNFVSNF